MKKSDNSTAHENGANEVSVIEILLRIWRSRGIIFATTLLAFLLGLALIAYAGFSARQRISHFITLNNISDSKYPNGSSFQPSDLISPQVLDNLRAKLALSNSVKMTGNISIAYDSPTAEGVTLAYKNRLSAKNLSQVEIAAINSSFKEDLESAVESNLRIEVDFVAMGVNQETAMGIAAQLPISWTEVYTRQFRTLVSNELSAVVTPMKIEDFNQAAGILLINAKIRQIEKGLNAIKNDNRLVSVQDSAGSTANDVQGQLDIYKDVYFNRIFSSLLDGDSATAKIFVRSQQLKVNQLNQQIAGLDAAFEKLGVREEKSSDQIAAGASQNTSQQPLLQVDTDAFSQIISLADRASNADYLRGLLTKRQDLIEEASEYSRQLSMVESTTGSNINDRLFNEQSFQGLASIIASYNQLLSSARARAEERSGALFETLAPPSKRGSLIDIRSVFLTIALTILGFVLAAAYAVFLRENKSAA